MTGVVIVDSRLGVREAAEPALTDAGFRVFSASSPADGAALAQGEAVHAALIQWAGATPLQEFLAHLSAGDNGSGDIRVIVVADEVAREQAVQALDLGVDDCLIHPFGGGELLARVRAALRRPALQANGELISAGSVHLDKAAHRVFVAGHLLELAPTEFRLLRFFLENQGRVFSRQELLDRAWSDNVHAGPRTVDVHVRRLRQALEPFSCEYMIQTVRGFGYRFSPLSTESMLGTARPQPASITS